VSLFRNWAELTDHGSTEVRRVALEVAEAGLRALDPRPAVEAALRRQGVGLDVGGVEYRPAGRVVLLGAGKASYRLALGVEAVLGERLEGGIVVVRRGEGGPLARVRVVEADHPVPSESSLAAGRLVLELAGALGPDDLAICCITGGSSALLSVPPDGVSYEAKRRLHQLLLSSGMSIFDMNAVRKHVSAIKGGRLAQRIAPARLLNLTVSDVAGDALDFVTGDTVADTTTPAEAIGVLRRHHLWDRVDPTVRHHLLSPAADSPSLDGLDSRSLVLLTGDDACRAMAAHAEGRGYHSLVLSTTLSGEAASVGSMIAGIARECARSGRPVSPPCVLVGCGGESTVSLPSWDGTAGRGGPNQEVVLGAAGAMDGDVPMALLSLDTDGTDGGTSHAGGLADAQTLRRALAMGQDIDAALAEHCSSKVLAGLGDLVKTGPTGTNVNDLFVAVVGTR
jgi:glycerate 2-kinase